jgi:hypothetical protein
VELENLEPGKEYLLNVDGYLHDFCSFEMELSLTPLGLPAVQKIQLDASDYVQNDTLKYFWTTPDSLLGTITSYNLHRRKSNEFKFTFLKNFPTKKDAFGEVKKEFQYREILEREHTPWAYKLVAETSGESFIADEFSAREYRRSPEKMHYRIPVEIAFMEKAELSLKLVDYLMGVVLEEKTINYLPGDYKPVYFDVGEYIELGVKRFHLEIKNLDTNELFRVEYEYSKEDGLKEVR